MQEQMSLEGKEAGSLKLYGHRCAHQVSSHQVNVLCKSSKRSLPYFKRRS